MSNWYNAIWLVTVNECGPGDPTSHTNPADSGETIQKRTTFSRHKALTCCVKLQFYLWAKKLQSYRQILSSNDFIY